MKVHTVETVEVLGVPDGVHSLAKSETEAHDCVLVRGRGKSRFLELLVGVKEALAPAGEQLDHTPFVRWGNATSKAIVRWALDAREQKKIGAASPIVTTEIIFGEDNERIEETHAGFVFLLGAYAHDDVTPKLEYFSERRRLDVGGGNVDLSPEAQITYRVDGSPRKLAWLPNFIAALPLDPQRSARFARGLEQLSASCRWDPAKNALHSRGRRLAALEELTASEGDAVGFAASAALVGLSNSMLLVDRPELFGLDPVKAMLGLASLGQSNQLVLASDASALASHGSCRVIDLGGGAA